ncbi:MAG: DUF2804 family protein [bacterium]
MIEEGFVPIKWRRNGATAFLRRKQWWSFEGLDEAQGVYFVFLAMQSFPAGYVSITAIDLKNGKRVVEEQLTGIQSLPGEKIDISSKGKWGTLAFRGNSEINWQLEIDSNTIKASIKQTARSALHRKRLLTKKIDYTLLQSVLNDIEGTISFAGRDINVRGVGYFEHAWGVQPRLSVANWMHFWAPNASGVVMDCMYDAGVPHNYTYIWSGSQNKYLYSPAHFSFNPERPEEPWKISSPDLDLDVAPIIMHRMKKKIPPVFPYIDIDYFELLAKISGGATVNGASISINGFGKYDYNFNRW